MLRVNNVDSMITVVIMVITALISILAFNNSELFGKISLQPYLIQHRKEWYRVFTHAFVHADWTHLAINMLVLYSFGRFVEISFASIWGLKGFFWYVILYIGGILFSVVYSLQHHKDNPAYSAVGASGAVSAIVFASILLNPGGGIRFIFFPFFDIPSFVFGGIYLIYSAIMAKKANDHIAHDAHFFGAVFGFIFPIILKPALILHFFNSIMNIF